MLDRWHCQRFSVRRRLGGRGERGIFGFQPTQQASPFFGIRGDYCDAPGRRQEGDCRRICGLPPTYTVLEAVRPGRGKMLHYDQYVHPQGYESVSFASVAFYK